MTKHEALHIARNPWGHPEDLVREARLYVCDALEAAEREREEARAERDDLAAYAEAVADAIGFPAHNDNRRKTSVIVTNIENMRRFADYLHAVEQEFLMVPGEPDDDYPDEEPEDECLVSCWSARSTEHYVEQFRQALATRDGRLADAIKRASEDRAVTEDCPRYEAGMKIAASMVRHWHKEGV